MEIPRDRIGELCALPGFTWAAEYGTWGKATALPREIGIVERVRFTVAVPMPAVRHYNGAFTGPVRASDFDAGGC